MWRCFLFLLLCFPVQAQKLSKAAFFHLPSDAIAAKGIYGQQFDQKGRMWMACNEGLACYNGYTTLIKTKKPGNTQSLLGYEIQSLLIDSKSRIWICYRDTTGISYYDPENDHFRHYYSDSTRRDAAPMDVLVGFSEDSKGRIWIMSWDGGLFLLDPVKGSFKNWRRDFSKEWDSTQPLGNRIKVMRELSDGRFMVCYFDGGAPSGEPCYFDAERGIFEVFPVEQYLNNKDEQENHQIRKAIRLVHYFYCDAKENYWFGTYSGLLFFDRKNKQARRVSGIAFESSRMNLDNARSILEADHGKLWVATSNTGIMVVDPESFEVEYIRHYPLNRSSVSANQIFTMRKDPQGNIWVSTATGGMDVYAPLQQQFRILPWEDMNLEYNNRSAQIIPVNQMLVKNSREIYISNANGMSVVRPADGAVLRSFSMRDFAQGSGLKNDVITSFRFLGDTLFLFAEKDVFLVLPGEKSALSLSAQLYNYQPGMLFRYLKKAPLCISHRQRDGLVFLRGDQLLQKGRADSIVLTKEFLYNTAYSELLPSGNWMLPLLDGKGFYTINPHTHSTVLYSYYSKNHFFPDTTLICSHVDAEGKIWIGTAHGLYLFDEKTGEAVLQNDKIGIADESINAMLTDQNGDRWIALQRDLLRWSPRTGKVFRFSSDFGLNIGEFIPSVAQMDEKGRIYIAALSGILTFDPSHIRIPETKAQLFFSSVLINDDTLNETGLNQYSSKILQLPWSAGNIQADVYSDQLYSPFPPVYYYRLIGLDSVWKENGASNRIRFTNLSHGDYCLEIKMSNRFKVESEVLRLHFSIARPFWFAWWFYLIIVLGLFALVYLYIRYRERVHKERQFMLEQKIAERTAEVVQKAEEIRLQKDIIFEKNKELTDSIHYAQRIQQAMLPDKKVMEQSMPEHFVLFRPKDIVSGDFYWHHHTPQGALWSVVDCTGHGVPGGFMSMLGSGLLNQIVTEEKIYEPDIILNELRERVIVALKQSGEAGESRDGMDISLVRYLPGEQKVLFAGAHHSLYHLRGETLTEFRGDKQPIGIHGGEMKPFRLHEVHVAKGDMLYMSTDGYADQFGGEKGKKFKSSNFELLLKKIALFPLGDQHQMVDSTFISWKGNFEQLDDVCIIGVRF